MADPAHLQVLQQGTAVWNQWRQAHPRIIPNLLEAPLGSMDLSGADLRWVQLGQVDLRRALLRAADLRWADCREANLREARLRQADLGGAYLAGVDLSGAHLRDAHLGEAHLGKGDLSGADLSRACLQGAHLSGAHLIGARLSGADLRGATLRQAHLRRARLRGANLRQADLSEANFLWASLPRADLRDTNCCGTDLRRANLAGADLRGADMRQADLSGADLRGADLRDANLMYARLVEANLTQANLAGCAIYGMSAWGIKLQETGQLNLRLTPDETFAVRVDTLEVAQLISLHLQSLTVQEAVETLGKKIVLILGRFDAGQQPLLGAIRSVLRLYHYVPVVCDLPLPVPPGSLETVRTLTRMARFVLADMTATSEALAALPAFLQHAEVPVQLLFWKNATPDPDTVAALREDYEVLLEPYWYRAPEDVRASLAAKVLAPAETKAKALLSARVL